MLLKDKIALVTGSTHNICLAIARAFADEGAKMIVHSRHEEDAKKVAQEICADYFVADLAKPEQIAALFDHIREKYGRLDILVNSVAQSSSAGVLETSLDEWNRIMTINLTGYFLCIQHAGKMMKEQGGGAIINISAGSGERSSPGGAAYSVSKGAINALTKQAAPLQARAFIRGEPVQADVTAIFVAPAATAGKAFSKTCSETITARAALRRGATLRIDELDLVS